MNVLVGGLVECQVPLLHETKYVTSVTLLRRAFVSSQSLSILIHSPSLAPGGISSGAKRRITQYWVVIRHFAAERWPSPHLQAAAFSNSVT